MDFFYIDKGYANHNPGSKNYDSVCEDVENCNGSFLKNDKNGLKYDLLYSLPNLESNKKLEKTRQSNPNMAQTYLINSHTKVSQKRSSISGTAVTNINCTTGLEKEYAIPTIKKKILKLKQKKLREKTKGKKWFDMPASEVTDDIKADFQILKMRAVLDKNHVYKKNNLKHISKYFQVGTVVENAADFYNGRIPKSQRRKTIVDELLADAECRTYQKKKYKEIMSTNERRIKSAGLKKKKKKINK